MVAPKRPYTATQDESYTSLPTHFPQDHQHPNYTSSSSAKKRRTSLSSTVSNGVFGWIKQKASDMSKSWTPKRPPPPPRSESGTSVASSSNASRASSPGVLNGVAAHGGDLANGSRHTRVNGHASGGDLTIRRPRKLDDMLRPSLNNKGKARHPAEVERQQHSRSTSQASRDPSPIKSGSGAPPDSLGLTAYSGGSLAMLEAFNQTPGHRPESASEEEDIGTVKGKGKGKARAVDVTPPPEEASPTGTTPTYEGSRSRPILLSSPSRPTPSQTPMLFPESFSAPQWPASASGSATTSSPPPTPPPPHQPDSAAPASPPNSSRLNLDNSSYQRSYPWLASTRRSPVSVTSSSTSTSRKLRKKKSSNLRDRTDRRAKEQDEKRLQQFYAREYEKLPEGKSKTQVGRLLSGLVARRKRQKQEAELSYQRQVASGNNSAHVLRAMLSQSVLGSGKAQAPTADPVAQFRKAPQLLYDPRKSMGVANDARKRHANQKYVSPVDDILGRLKLEDDEIEARLKERLRPKLPKKLDADQSAIVQKSLDNPSFESIHGVECVTAKSLERLAPGVWLDDEIMNFYGSLIKARSEKEGKIKLHYFNSFFYQKLETQGYVKSKLARWTKKVDIFAQDLVIFPINVGGMHWTAGVIDFQKKRIEYYDSLGDGRELREDFYDNIREYLQAEHMDKKKTEFDLSGWENAWNDASPQQSNGSDCGVFSCQTLENRSRGKDLVGGEFEFTSFNMPYFRDLMVWEIATKQLRQRW